MEEIILSNEVKIYKTKFISPYPSDRTIEMIRTNLLVNKRTTDDRIHYNVGPGIQSPLILKCPEIDTIIDHAVNTCRLLYNKDVVGHLIHSWIAVSRNDRTKISWHKHINFAPPYNFVETDLTFTYYIQMPDNLSNDDGMLLFKTKDDKIHKFLPEENDLFIFSPDLEHVVEWNKESTKERIVLASNIKFISTDKKLNQCTQKIL